jgi:hypothetical protein
MRKISQYLFELSFHFYTSRLLISGGRCTIMPENLLVRACENKTNLALQWIQCWHDNICRSCGTNIVFETNKPHFCEKYKSNIIKIKWFKSNLFFSQFNGDVLVSIFFPLLFGHTYLFFFGMSDISTECVFAMASIMMCFIQLPWSQITA